MHNRKQIVITALTTFAVILALGASSIAQDKMMKDDKMMAAHHSTTFKGKAVNGGHVIHSKEGKINILTLSDDFVAPGSPDPHWQVVDSKGTVYDLGRLLVKGTGDGMGANMTPADMKPSDKLKKQIRLPAYVKDVAKVIIYCAWAEVDLGEASFEKPVM
ncbi:MAG TPA: hypothetical protein VNK82_08095 [Terriglobales bacterium]|nr:hypothetical protein [Terriglobales bacterium]